MKPHKLSTHLAFSDNCYFHLFLSVVWLSWNFARFHEIQFQTEPESFSFLSWKTKKIYSWKKNFLSRCQYQNKKSLFTDSIFQKVLTPMTLRVRTDDAPIMLTLWTSVTLTTFDYALMTLWWRTYDASNVDLTLKGVNPLD